MTVAESVGSCNTQLTAKNGRLRIKEVGIDTWRVARYLNDPELARAKKLCPGPVAPARAGEHRWGLIPGCRMLWFEGHPVVDGLGNPAGLTEAQDRVLADLEDHGVPIGSDGGVRRFDQTVTLEFADPQEGRAFLQGMASVDVPRSKPAVYGRPVETVYLLGGASGKVLARCYDKGVESGDAQRGKLIRLENQTRLRKEVAEYYTSEAIAKNGHLVGTHFHHRFAPVALSAEGVHAATAPVLAERVTELVGTGRLSASKGARLLGFLVAGDRLDVPDRTRRRWRHELREFGLVLVDPLEDAVQVDLGEPLEAALAAWSGDEGA